MLIALILLIGGIGRIWKLWEIESVKTKELEPKVEQLEKQIENLNNENIILKKEVSKPIRDRVLSEIRQVFGSRAKEAIRVAKCESGLDPDRINRNNNLSFDSNVFQINSVHIKRFGGEFVTNWYKNIEIAHKLFLEQGFEPWRASNKCHGLLTERK